MPSKSRGGLSKQEVKAKKAGTSLASKQVKTSGVSDTSSQYKALMKKYEKTLSPSKTEKKAQSSLDKLTSSYESGVAKSGQEVQPMDLITGEKRAKLEQYGVGAGVYQRTIASEQAKRGAASDVLSAQSGLLEKQIASETSKSEKEQDYKNQLALIAARKGGGGGSEKLTSVSKKVGRNTIYGTFNPKTGEYKWSE